MSCKVNDFSSSPTLFLVINLIDLAQPTQPRIVHMLVFTACQGKFFSEASLAGEQAARDAALHPYEQHAWPFVQEIQCYDVSYGVA